MSTELLEQPVETVNPSMIVHISHVCDPFTAICGMEILGHWTTEPVDCVMCLDLLQASIRCPHCGGHLG